MLRRAAKFFQDRDFINALKIYSLIYKDYPENLEAKAGILLCSLPSQIEEDVIQLYDFYNIAKTFDEANSYEALEALIESLESGLTRSSDGSVISFDDLVESEEGISYSDFKKVLEESDDFKEVFQNVFFSTKVIITQKNDFFDFINTLIEHEYIEMALSYIDNASTVFPADEKIRELLKKIKEH